MKNHSDSEAKRQKKATKTMCDAFLVMQSRDEILNLLNDLCTPAELEAITDRWWVLQLLQEKIPYRQISDRTGVSVTTIGRVARYWREGAGGYQLALERINK